VLGLSAVAKYVITGRILGISGTVRGLLTVRVIHSSQARVISGSIGHGASWVGPLGSTRTLRPGTAHQGDWRSWRVAFLLGLLGGAVVAAGFTPSIFDVLPATYTVCLGYVAKGEPLSTPIRMHVPPPICNMLRNQTTLYSPPACATQLERAMLGGLLVGLGSSMGNGCTSGHGICGNARLSPRQASGCTISSCSGIILHGCLRLAPTAIRMPCARSHKHPAHARGLRTCGPNRTTSGRLFSR
jgi:uncharacterized membrane protein YedE/YeeE